VNRKEIPLKVLFLTQGLERNPSAKARVLDFLPSLTAAGLECVVSPALSNKDYHLHYRLTAVDQLRYWSKIVQRRLRNLRRIDDFDIVFLQREVISRMYPVFELLIARRHPRMIFDFDDNLFANPPVKRNRGPFYQAALSMMSDSHNIERIIRASRKVIAGNKYLEERARRFNPNVVWIPTAMQLNRYTIRPQSGRGDRVVIGWKGSTSTSQYLTAITPVFHRLRRRFGARIQFIINGDPEYLPTVAGMTVTDFRLDHEISDLHEFDIGIMPLDDDEWVRGKGGGKALEYMAVGIPAVASPIGAPEYIITHGETGYLASSLDQWEFYLSKLIEDRSLRERIGAAARRRIEEHFSTEAVFPNLLATLQEVAANSGTSAT
jgi:glycosyltransferase involved in cell wall biosynthesis